MVGSDVPRWRTEITVEEGEETMHPAEEHSWSVTGCGKKARFHIRLYRCICSSSSSPSPKVNSFNVNINSIFYYLQNVFNKSALRVQTLYALETHTVQLTIPNDNVCLLLSYTLLVHNRHPTCGQPKGCHSCSNYSRQVFSPEFYTASFWGDIKLLVLGDLV